MQPEIDKPEIYYCRKCGFEAETVNPECPRCGRKMQTRAQIKSLGKVLVVLGIIISLGSGLLVLAIFAVLLFSEIKDEDTVMIFSASAFFGAALAAGISAIIGGAWQAKHGRTSKMFIWIFFGLAVLMIIVGRIFSFLKS